jgi:hypothetical protein
MLKRNTLSRQLGLGAVLLWLLLPVTDAQQQETVAQLAGKIDTEIDQLTSTPAGERAQQLTTSLRQHLRQLQEQSIMIFGSRRQQLAEKLQQVSHSLEEWQAARASDDTRAAAVNRIRACWSEINPLYPREALQILPGLWSCPMHQELMVTNAGTCPTCGMPLEPIYVTQPQLTQSPIIRAEIVAKAPLEVGKRADLRIRLSFMDTGEPVQLSDLEEAHTRKIHLLISDNTETDYHHEHPEPVADGEYAFSFTPQRPDTYRVWADLMPVRTRVQQYSVADIPSNTPRRAQLAQEESENRHAEIDGYKFDLSFEKEPIRERETVAGKLRVVQPDGQPCKNLGVVMGAFGHFVGFCDDAATVLHLHPTGLLASDPEAKGGPELPFYFRANKVGLVRLFAQVRINGKDFFPRFVMRVQSLQRLPNL